MTLARFNVFSIVPGTMYNKGFIRSTILGKSLMLMSIMKFSGKNLKKNFIDFSETV